ncbi:MAG: NAD(P)-dependent alcohol dehydrogenase [Myxococcales bacterium]|nr:NAD(P)-dependent alcohol dehydrogenase [Myxococcales bacterium]
MKALEIQGEFGFEHLTFVERPSPPCGPGQVRLAMRAASLNYRDLLMVRGQYNPRQPLPLIPCSDGVGVVTEVGDGVTDLEVGARVATLFAQGWGGGEPSREKFGTTLGGPLDGTLAEELVLDRRGVIEVPEHLTDAEAACLPCAAVTAWSALVTEGQVRAGDTVLLQGTGGVSLFALQFATVLGARVIITSSSDDKLDRALQLGAWKGINYKDDPAWGRTARKLTGGRGVDLVVEVGGTGTLEQSLKAVRVGGTIAMIGILSGALAPLLITPILMQQIRVQGVFVGSGEGFAAMNRAIDAHQLTPLVHRVYPFDEAPQAMRDMTRGEHFGKIAITIP